MALLQDFKRLMSFSLEEYVACSGKINALLQEQAVMVKQVFVNQCEFIEYVAHHSKPSDDTLKVLLEPIFTVVMSIKKHRESHRSSPYFHHLSTISESAELFGWVAVPLNPAGYAKDHRDAGAYFGQKVSLAGKSGGGDSALCAQWVNIYLQLLDDLVALIKLHCRYGLSWNELGSASQKGSPACAAPPPPPPPPPPMDFMADNSATQPNADSDDARSALLKDLSIGTDITKRLKKVDKVKAAVGSSPSTATASNLSLKATQKRISPERDPVLELEGKKWRVEYHNKNESLKIEVSNMSQSVYMYKCNQCVLHVKGKVNCIVLDACKKVDLCFDDLVSSLEVLDCRNINVQPLGSLPTVIIDKTDSISLFLGKDSLGTEIISSKSSGININVPSPDGNDFIECPVPEQFKSYVSEGTLKTIPIHKN